MPQRGWGCLSIAMEEKTPEQINMKLPEYKYQVPLSRKRWIVGIGLVVLLIGIIVAATLIGVYMTQKHMEKMVTLVFSGRDEQKVQQTIFINEQENMAAIFTSSKEYSATVLYDYKRNIIGIRKMNSSKCYVLRMDKSQAPSIQEILTQMDVKTHNASTDADITYHIAPEQVANPIDVGMSVNLLCSDATIYWSRLVSQEDRRWFKWPKIRYSASIQIGRK